VASFRARNHLDRRSGYGAGDVGPNRELTSPARRHVSLRADVQREVASRCGTGQRLRSFNRFVGATFDSLGLARDRPAIIEFWRGAISLTDGLESPSG